MNVQASTSIRAGIAGVEHRASMLNRAQRDVFDRLLEVGAERPTCSPTLADDLHVIIEEGTRDALAAWTETSLWISKSQLSTVRRCEGQTITYASEQAPANFSPAAVVGIIAHRAIQLAYTDPDQTLKSYVQWATEAALADEEKIRRWWENASVGQRSDVTAAAIERVGGFMDTWPPLDERWEPRFEVSLEARIGRLKLAGRVDLMLGRPRPPRQTMLLCDLKSDSINESHPFEAAFYALLATLRFGVAPFRSVVYSLASGEWTEPADVTADLLIQTATEVAEAVSRHVALLTGVADPKLTPGRWCSWCPALENCAAGQSAVGAPTRARTVTPEPALRLVEDDQESTSPHERKEPHSREPIDDFGPFTIDTDS